ncbi:hypothetical protein [Streptomyces sp. enrichment culture]|uniref:hypothetical protein n=1 Tax=Streptomyces sp. enrichment culture TaxID=1795815 RepID=UPI003F553907
MPAPSARITAPDSYDVRFPTSRDLIDFRHPTDALAPDEALALLRAGRAPEAPAATRTRRTP